MATKRSNTKPAADEPSAVILKVRGGLTYARIPDVTESAGRYVGIALRQAAEAADVAGKPMPWGDLRRMLVQSYQTFALMALSEVLDTERQGLRNSLAAAAEKFPVLDTGKETIVESEVTLENGRKLKVLSKRPK